MSRYLIAGNWKMHGSLAFNRALCDGLLQEDLPQVEMLVCPPTIYIPQVASILQDSNVLLGGQNCHFEPKGAYTGEVSPQMLRDFGCSYVIIGHSERRQYFAETNALVAQKSLAAFEAGLTPIICVGETQQQRENGSTFEVIGEQMNTVLEALPEQALSSIVIAYEPVWAIGTGLTASPEQAQEVHAYIRDLCAKVSPEVAKALRILYGGSVKPNNAAELFQQADINGGLIGGASLKAEDFIAICRQVTEMA